MSIALVGSVGSTRGTSSTASSAFGQTPTSGNLLVAVISGTGTTAANWTVSSSSAGWAQLITAPIGNNTSGTSQAGVDVWFKVATASETAPTFTLGLSGTVSCEVNIFELSGAGAHPVADTIGSYSSGAASSTLSSMTATTANSVAAAGEFAISVFVMERSATTVTWTETGSGWTSQFSDGATSSTGHRQVNSKAGPASGATLNDAGSFSTNTSAFGAGVVVVLAPNKISSDSGSGADGGVPGVIGVSSSDSGTGHDQVQWGGERLHLTETQFVTVSSSDSGSGSDAQGGIGIAALESGTGGESSRLTATLAGTDSAAGTDTQGGIGIAALEVGSGADTQGGIGIAVLEAGSVSESSGLAATLAGTDSGTGSDAGALVLLASDAGTGTDGGEHVTAALADSDAGTGTDTGGRVISDSDFGTGLDQVWWGGERLHLVETESVSTGNIPVQVSDSDFASGTDDGEQITATLADTDVGTGLDQRQLIGVTVRGSSAGSSGGSAVSSIVTSFPAGTQMGDFCLLVVINDAAAPGNWSVSAGAGFSHLLHDQVTDGGLSASVWVYQVVTNSDTAPTIANTQPGRLSWAMFAATPDIGGYYPRIDANGADFASTAPASQFTPGGAMSSGSDISVVLNGSRAKDTGATAIGLTPSAGWTAGSSAGYGGDVNSPASLASLAYAAGATGLVQPGSETLVTSVPGPTWSVVYHFLLTEFPPGTAVSGSDASSAAAEAQRLTADVPAAESGTGADAEQLTAGNRYDTDAGSGAEAQFVLVSSADAGTGAALERTGTLQVASADAATAADGGEIILVGNDVGGTGAESQQVTARVQSADAGTGAEAQFKTQAGLVAKFDSDSGHGQEGDTEPAVSQEAASGADTESLLGLPSDAEAAAGDDEQQLIIAVNAVYDTDGGTGAEMWMTSGPKAGSDGGSGDDEQSGFLAFADADAGTGSEAQFYLIEIWPFPPPWLYQSPGGGYLVIWRRGTPEEVVVRSYPRLHRHQLAEVEEFIDRIRHADAVRLLGDEDSGGGREAHRPTASVLHWAATSASVEHAAGAAALVMQAEEAH